MSYRDHCFQRLLALAGRDIQEFPPHLLPEDSHPAAVLIPLWPTPDGGVEIAFTKRTDSLPTHRGQVSFPGGGRHPQDESLERTALREANEELGIPASSIIVMGRLDDAWSFQGHHVVPYVGWLESRPEIRPDPGEVAEVIVADLVTLGHPETVRHHSHEREGRRHYSHAFEWEGGYVWGLTADILLELLLWFDGRESNRGELRLARMQEQLGVRSKG